MNATANAAAVPDARRAFRKAPGEHEGEHQRREDGAVVRRVRIAAGREMEGHAERTGDDVGLRVGQRVAIGMEDVGLEERRREPW